MIDAVTVDMVAMAYIVALGGLGFFFLWSQWRYIKRAEEEYKAYVREIVDRHMKEHER